MYICINPGITPVVGETGAGKLLGTGNISSRITDVDVIKVLTTLSTDAASTRGNRGGEDFLQHPLDLLIE